jgi:hypothetical protein|tara:strand:- start:29 stop:199 length:171 start_codon:yes stop_codon:yes gene_type:complete
MIETIIPEFVTTFGIPGLALYYIHDLAKNVVTTNTEAIKDLTEVVHELRGVIQNVK